MAEPAISPHLTAREIVQWVEYHRAEGFSGPTELLDFIEVFWGLRIPQAKVCPEHTPPAEYITAGPSIMRTAFRSFVARAMMSPVRYRP